MTQSLTTKQGNAMESIEEVLMTGNLSGLNAEQRVLYHNRVCESLGLNPLTRPFDYLTLNSKLILYARKDATDQLRALRGIDISEIRREQVGDLLIVTASAITRDGRRDESTGVVNVKGLAGEALANALMKAETKAKRRVTLSIAGLGLLDESEAADGAWDDGPPAREPFKKPQALSERATEPEQQQPIVNEDTGELPPSWTVKELGAALNSAGLKVGDLGTLFGFPVNKDNVVDSVDRWLSDNESSTLPDLVAAAVEARFEPAPEDVVESEEQQPAMAMAMALE